MTAEKERFSQFNEWAEATTAHGFLDYSRSRTRLSKMIWALLIAISLLIMTYQLARTVKDFVDQEWKTSVEERPPPAEGVQFPSTIVCNANRLKWSKAQQYNLSIEMIKFMFLNLFLTMGDYVTFDKSRSIEQQFISWRKAKNFSYMDFFDKLAPSCEDLFLPEMCEQTEDNPVTIVPIDTFEFGRCHRIDFNSSIQQVGSKFGAYLFLNVQTWDYLPFLSNNLAYEGIEIQIAYDGKIEMGKWITLQQGRRTTIGLQVIESSVRLPEQWFLNPFAGFDSKPPCEISPPKMRFLNDNQYSVGNCQFDCGLLHPVHMCGCVPFMRHDKYRTCEFEEINRCTGYGDDLNVADISPKLIALIKQCTDRCKQPCYSRDFEMKISSTRFPSGKQTDDMRTWLVEQNIESNRTTDFIFLQIYFHSLATKYSEQYVVMNVENLVSNAGGLIGLWAGMSFLTVFQAIAYFIEYLRRKAQRSNHATSLP